MTMQTDQVRTQSTLWQTVRAELPFFLLIVAGIFAFRSLFFNMNYIPSESMQPALEVGDRILVNKTAYGWSGHSILFSAVAKLPGKHGRFFGSMPKRGDVITFKHPKTGVIMIKRVIGLPGDRIQYDGGRLYMNGELADREKIETYEYKAHKGGVRKVELLTETVEANISFSIYEAGNQATLDNTDEFTVPVEHIFVMGDNRDNSVDSRDMRNGVGFVPTENILGRAERILFSTYTCKKNQGLHCAKRNAFAAIK